MGECQCLTTFSSSSVPLLFVRILEIFEQIKMYVCIMDWIVTSTASIRGKEGTEHNGDGSSTMLSTVSSAHLYWCTIFELSGNEIEVRLV